MASTSAPSCRIKPNGTCPVSFNCQTHPAHQHSTPRTHSTQHTSHTARPAPTCFNVISPRFIGLVLFFATHTAICARSYTKPSGARTGSRATSWLIGQISACSSSCGVRSQRACAARKNTSSALSCIFFACRVR